MALRLAHKGCQSFGLANWSTHGGRLAQLVERLVYTEDVSSSSLLSPTIPSSYVMSGNRNGRKRVFVGRPEA